MNQQLLDSLCVSGDRGALKWSCCSLTFPFCLRGSMVRLSAPMSTMVPSWNPSTGWGAHTGFPSSIAPLCRLWRTSHTHTHTHTESGVCFVQPVTSDMTRSRGSFMSWISRQNNLTTCEEGKKQNRFMLFSSVNRLQQPNQIPTFTSVNATSLWITQDQCNTLHTYFIYSESTE